MELHAGHHYLVTFANMTFQMDTIYMTWLVSAIIIVTMIIATRGLSIVPGPVQNVIEMAIDALDEQFRPVLGAYASQLSAILFTMFFFILVSNEIGLIPSPHLLTSPTSDINTTLALAIATSLLVWIMGIRVQGIGYFKHFFQPFKVFIIINLIEELARPLTLAVRLFGNIIAGEILLEVLNNLVPYLVPGVWIAFSLFIGVVQAFIFTILATSYLGGAVSVEH